MSQDRGELCRLLVVGPASQVDVSLPTHIPLADMMPALLNALGPDLADRGLEHSGWIVQRLGGPALDEARTVADLELLDGEAVHVRPRTDQIPPLAYDDLIDGVSAGIGKRSGLWRPQTTRLAAVLLLGGWLGTGLAAVQVWPAGTRRITVFAVAAVLCYAAGLFVTRKYADRVLAGILGAASVTATAMAVALAIEVPWQSMPGAVDAYPAPIRLLAAVSAGTIAAVLVAAFVFPRAGWRQVSVGLALLWLFVAAAVGLRVQGALDWTAIAAVMAVATTVLRPAVPTLAFKFAGFSLPDMPTEPGDLQQEIEPEDSAEVLAGAATADQFMTAIYTALGLVSGAAMVWLAAAPGWLAPLAAWLAAVAQLLVTRPMTSTWHRLALGGPAMVAMVTWCLTATALRDPSTAVLAMAFCVTLMSTCGTAARILPGRKVSPIWGRLGDWAHTLALAALGPVVAALLGLFALIRSQVG
jgi:type VII secretion integral membrane protein EccD